jgi:hypothetical protein
MPLRLGFQVQAMPRSSSVPVVLEATVRSRRAGPGRAGYFRIVPVTGGATEGVALGHKGCPGSG